MLIRIRLITLLAAISGVWAGGASAQHIGTEVSFVSPDNTVVIGYWYQVSPSAPTIMLFHMGGASARGEYKNIAPRLNGYGYNTLAVDLRSGGDRLGGHNQTMARLGKTDTPYCAAYPDLEASLDWLKAQNISGPLIAWGSSYSATLTIQLAARRGADLSGALAFSPASGGPMAGCKPDDFLAALDLPLLTLRPESEMEVDSVQAQASLFRQQGLTYLEMRDGQHGSLMLDEARTGKNMNHVWGRVLTFLDSVVAAPEVADVTTGITLNSEGWLLKGDMVRPKGGGSVPAALLLSQAAGSRRDHTRLASKLAAAGIASLRLDLRGHGGSINKGAFLPPYAENRGVLKGTEHDVQTGLRYLKSLDYIDAGKIAVISGSYSTEYAMIDARSNGYAHAYVALSPGSFSLQSTQAINESGAKWLFVRAEVERPFFDDIFADIRLHGSKATIKIVPGEGHAINLLGLVPTLPDDIVQWLSDNF